MRILKIMAHGMFQSVYDYPYLSSSANHIIDLTAAWATDSPLSSSLNVTLRNKKMTYIMRWHKCSPATIVPVVLTSLISVKLLK